MTSYLEIATVFAIGYVSAFLAPVIYDCIAGFWHGLTSKEKDLHIDTRPSLDYKHIGTEAYGGKLYQNQHGQMVFVNNKGVLYDLEYKESKVTHSTTYNLKSL